jgi:hypothetical protein
VIAQISQADAQVMMQSVGDADGEAEAEESLGEAEGVEVVIAPEEYARNCSRRGRLRAPGEAFRRVFHDDCSLGSSDTRRRLSLH